MQLFFGFTPEAHFSLCIFKLILCLVLYSAEMLPDQVKFGNILFRHD